MVQTLILPERADARSGMFLGLLELKGDTAVLECSGDLLLPFPHPSPASILLQNGRVLSAARRCSTSPCEGGGRTSTCRWIYHWPLSHIQACRAVSSLAITRRTTQRAILSGYGSFKSVSSKSGLDGEPCSLAGSHHHLLLADTRPWAREDPPASSYCWSYWRGPAWSNRHGSHSPLQGDHLPRRCHATSHLDSKHRPHLVPFPCGNGNRHPAHEAQYQGLFYGLLCRSSHSLGSWSCPWRCPIQGVHQSSRQFRVLPALHCRCDWNHCLPRPLPYPHGTQASRHPSRCYCALGGYWEWCYWLGVVSTGGRTS